MKKNDFTLHQIGYAKTSFLYLKDCPFQGNDDCPPACIHIDPMYSMGLQNLEPGQDIVIITLLDKASRDKLQCRPRNDPGRPLRGVFATRSPNRPNPLGLHQVKIISMDKNVITVHPLEVLDNTPIIDIKPVLRSKEKHHAIYRYFSSALVDLFLDCSRQACVKGLLNGLNGNLSIRNDKLVLITSSGSAKGLLTPDDLCVTELSSGKTILGGKMVSSESAMHYEIYKNQPGAKAIAHVHPLSILTLDALVGDSILESINMFEARAIKSQVAGVPDHSPGSVELARSVGIKAQQYRCVIMRSHGLTCWGESLPEAVGLCDELEALAKIELSTLLLKNTGQGRYSSEQSS